MPTIKKALKLGTIDSYTGDTAQYYISTISTKVEFIWNSHARECVLWEFLVKVEHSLMLEIYCEEIRKKKRKKEKIRERMLLKCDATVLCKIFSENLRNQNRKTFISVFAYFLSVYAKSLFQWRRLGTKLLHHVVLRFCQHFLIS